MNIEINNFGIIKNAKIELAPLNIFIGSNSSGKSFTARLIHCFNCNDITYIDDELFKYMKNTSKILITTLVKNYLDMFRLNQN